MPLIRKRYIFDAQSLAALLTHYTDGAVPPDAEIRNAGPHKVLSQWLGLEVRSAQWGDCPTYPGTGEPYPMHIRYEGRKVVIFDEKGAPMRKFDSPEAPQKG